MKRAKRRKQSEAQLVLPIHLRELGIKTIWLEFQFEPSRKWRADLAIPDHGILVECDGGMHSGGHKRGAALEDDYIRDNTAQMLGWRVFRFSNRQVLCGEAKEFICKFLTSASD